MPKYLIGLLEKIVSGLNRVFDFDLRVVNENGDVFIKDVVCGEDSVVCDYDRNYKMTIEEFAKDFSGSMILNSILSEAERKIVLYNFNFT